MKYFQKEIKVYNIAYYQAQGPRPFKEQSLKQRFHLHHWVHNIIKFQLYSSHQILLVKISSTTNKAIKSTIEHISLAPQVLDHSNNNQTNKNFISNI